MEGTPGWGALRPAFLLLLPGDLGRTPCFEGTEGRASMFGQCSPKFLVDLQVDWFRVHLAEVACPRSNLKVVPWSSFRLRLRTRQSSEMALNPSAPCSLDSLVLDLRESGAGVLGRARMKPQMAY